MKIIAESKGHAKNKAICRQISPFVAGFINAERGVAWLFRWVVAFFVLAVISALFGFGLIANMSFEIAKILFYVFLVLGVLSLIFGSRMFGGRNDEAKTDDMRE